MALAMTLLSRMMAATALPLRQRGGPTCTAIGWPQTSCKSRGGPAKGGSGVGGALRGGSMRSVGRWLALLVLCGVSVALQAGVACAERRLAFVIGNGKYT